MIRHVLIIIVLTAGLMALLVLDEQCYKMTGQGGILGFTPKNSFFGMDVSHAVQKLF